MQPIKRRYPPEHPFFDDGDTLFARLSRTFDEAIDSITESLDAVSIDEFRCSIKGCSKTFTNPLIYNQHFDLLHRYICESCKRHFPSNYLLELHLLETHDSYFEACREKGLDVYQCFIQSCKLKFINEETRRKHLVDVHRYPADFRFSFAKRNHGYKMKKKVKTKKLDEENESEMDIDSRKIFDTKSSKSSNSGYSTSSNNSNFPIKDELPTEKESCVLKVKAIKKCKPKNKDFSKVENVVHGAATSTIHAQSVNKNSRSLPKSISFGRGSQRGFVK